VDPWQVCTVVHSASGACWTPDGREGERSVNAAVSTSTVVTRDSEDLGFPGYTQRLHGG
jgi:hypothetical protein